MGSFRFKCGVLQVFRAVFMRARALSGVTRVPFTLSTLSGFFRLESWFFYRWHVATIIRCVCVRIFYRVFYCVVFSLGGADCNGAG